MGIAERKEREKLEMREKILQAATELFLEKGFEATSMRNIAQKIEYSPGTIYLHFKDKSELFFALHQQGFQRFHAVLQEVMHIENPYERLKAIGKQYLKFAFENPEMYDLMFIIRAPMESLREDECWNTGMTTHQCLIDTVEEGLQKGFIIGKDIHSVALVMWSMVHGIASLYHRDRLSMYPPEHIHQLIEQGMDTVMTGMGKRENELPRAG